MAFVSYSSILLGLILIAISPIRKELLKRFSNYGKDTLHIYLLHPYALYAMLLIWQKVDSIIGLVGMLLITLFTQIIVLLCTLVIKKIKDGTKVLLYK